MADIANGGGVARGDDPGEPFTLNLVPGLVWLAGLLSTIYLVCWALLLLYYAVGFSSYSSPGVEWGKAAFIGRNAIPLCCFAAIGFVGLKFWPRGRFRFWGLSAILVQTALAIVAFASPEGILVFTDWLG